MNTRSVNLLRGVIVLEDIHAADNPYAATSAPKLRRTFAVQDRATGQPGSALRIHCRSSTASASGGSFYLNLTAILDPFPSNQFIIAVSESLIDEDLRNSYAHIPDLILKRAAAVAENRSPPYSGHLYFASIVLHEIDHKDYALERAVEGIVNLALAGPANLTDDEIRAMFRGL
jgi:hypothetical protein